MNIEHKAWLAGFIDGEGYIGILKQRKKANRQQSDSLQYHPYLIITGTNHKIIKYIEKITGCGWIVRVALKGRRKTCFQYKLTKLENLFELLSQLQPFLKLKSTQSDLLKRFIKIRKNKVKITGRGTRGISSFGTEEEKIYQELRRLNKKGV